MRRVQKRACEGARCGRAVKRLWAQPGLAPELTMVEGLIYREERRQKHGMRGSSEQVDAVHVWARELVSEIEGQS